MYKQKLTNDYIIFLLFYLQHLLEHVLDPETKAKEILQSSFDLLGELMKFNEIAFQRFNNFITSDKQVMFVTFRNNSEILVAFGVGCGFLLEDVSLFSLFFFGGGGVIGHYFLK